MSFGSDIHVFICIGFALVESFDEWVYDFYNGGYLRLIYGGNLGILSYNLYHVIDGKYNFYWLFGAS